MFNEDERKTYDIRVQAMAELTSRVASAKAEGIAQGMEKGGTQGIKAMVVRASNSGMGTAEIARFFSLPEADVEAMLRDAEGHPSSNAS